MRWVVCIDVIASRIHRKWFQLPSLWLPIGLKKWLWVLFPCIHFTCKEPHLYRTYFIEVMCFIFAGHHTSILTELCYQALTKKFLIVKSIVHSEVLFQIIFPQNSDASKYTIWRWYEWIWLLKLFLRTEVETRRRETCSSNFSYECCARNFNGNFEF